MNVRLWLTYFELNAYAPRGIPWELGADLPGDESRFILPSIEEFRIGEGSNGDRLRAAAAAWADRLGDPDYRRVIELFIGEEQRHAAELARYLALNGHAARAGCGSDAAFRRLRHLTGRLEISLTVLLIAEIIGFVYYGALRAATRSALLRSICDTFLHDEAPHLLFHAEQLARMRRAGPRAMARLAAALSWPLMAGACALVWARHAAVLRRGGLTPGAFALRCFERLALLTRAPRRRVRAGRRREASVGF